MQVSLNLKNLLNRFSHKRLNEEELHRFIEQNEDFLHELRQTIGRTNMDDYFDNYLKEKNKNINLNVYQNIQVPRNAMIPAQMNPVNINNISNLPKNMLVQQSMPQNLPNQTNHNRFIQNIPMNIPNIPRPMMRMPFPQIPQNVPNIRFMPHMVTRNIQPQFPKQPNISNEVIFNKKNLDKNLNINELIQKINPFERPQVQKVEYNNPTSVTVIDKKPAINLLPSTPNGKAENLTESTYKLIYILVKSPSIKSDDEEETNFFKLKDQEHSKGESQIQGEQCDISNILQFVNMIKNKNENKTVLVKENKPVDPRIKKKKIN